MLKFYRAFSGLILGIFLAGFLQPFSFPTKAASVLSVPLTVTNNLAITRENEPVTTGIPLPKNLNIISTSDLNIRDKNQAIISSQFTVTARWGGAPNDTTKPIKWVLSTFYANVEPFSTATYYLVDGTKNTSPSTLIKEETTTDLTIHTGNADFTLDKQTLNFFKKVTVNGQIISFSSQNAFSLIDQTGLSYISTQNKPTISIIEQGPLRLALKIEGSLNNGSNSVLDYILYLYFYAGKSYVQAKYTVGNHQKAALNGTSYDVFNYNGQNSFTFQDLSLDTQIYSPSGALTYFAPGSKNNNQGVVQNFSVYQDSSGSTYWDRYNSTDNPRPNSYSSFKGYRLTNNGQTSDSGDHFGGWLDVSDSSKGITVAIEDFWQNYPKGFSVNESGQIKTQIFPQAYGANYNFRVGEEKTTSMSLFFHVGKGTAIQADTFAQALNNPLLALASADWYSNSKAVGDFAPETQSVTDRLGQASNLNDAGKYAYYNDRTLSSDPTISPEYYYNFHSLWESSAQAPSAIEYFNFYGWNAYGNQPLDFEMYGDGKAGYFDSKYDFDWGVWMQFLRTQDLRWKEMGEAFSKYNEQLMLHDVITETGWDIYRWDNAIFGHAQHNETGNQNGQRNYLGPVMDTAWGVRGSALYYYLTGYQPSKRFLDKAGEYAYSFYKDRFESTYLWNSAERYAANLLSILTTAFEATGDLKYQQLAQQFVDYYAAQKQPYINGPITSDMGNYVAPWMLGMYLNALGRYAQATETAGLLTESQSAKNNLVKYTDWLLKYGSYEYHDWLTTPYHYAVNGQNAPEDGMISNWMLTLADVCGYAYSFTKNKSYLDYGAKFFATGVRNPFYENSPLIYSTAKEAVNHASFGHVYLHYTFNPSVEDSFTPGPTSTSNNILQNGSANDGLNDWIIPCAGVSTMSVNNNSFFVLQSAYTYQDINLSDIPNFSIGADAKITIRGDLKAEISNADSGNPYFYGYLIGTNDNPNKINTYLNSGVSKSKCSCQK
ncbi:MAG: hypothetical protein UT55_C0053G0004 [Candidatus Peregrinibacteria bacterium GW2011_GWE2_39_6]|nr:MAG: hypothetical protein UT55_C0053G0004 [Candidatus Peregrinibacteria bacterium GW2011_GWE2_39_6]